MLTTQAETAEASALDDAGTLVTRAFVRARAGLLGAAVADVERIRNDSWDELDDADRAAVLATGLDCRLARGEIAAAMDLGDALDPLLDRPGMAGALAEHARGELSAATGDADRAGRHFARAGRLLAAAQDDPDLVPWRTGAALAAVRTGHRADGAALAREHVGLAREAGAPYAVALGLRTLASVDPRVDPVTTLREAREMLRDLPCARLGAQLDTDLAGLLVLGGRPGPEALALLRGAEEYAGREELWPLHGRVRRLLDRLGEPARPALTEALAGLTASERRVARLAAQGLTNRQIAGELVVTVKAVEWHLSRVYRKLGIRSRAGLVGTSSEG